jgi:acyl-coenzyme A thioesterase PaaI-like protein
VSDTPVSDGAQALGAAVRDLMDATVLTEADAEDRAALATEVDAMVQRLRAGGVRDHMLRPDSDGMRRGERPFSPVIGEANPLAPPMTVRVLDDGSVEGSVTLRAIHEGPPDAVHGGWVATVLDQLLGHANAAAGVPSYTVELTVRYRRPTPYGVLLTLRARTDDVEGRRVLTSGEIVADGVVTAEAFAVFKRPSERHSARLREKLDARS